MTVGSLAICAQAIEYSNSPIVADINQQPYGIRPELALGILIGSVCILADIKRNAEPLVPQHFENHPAICCGTAQDIQLQHQLISDGRWRIIRE